MAAKIKKQKRRNYLSIFLILGVIIIGVIAFFLFGKHTNSQYSQPLAEVYTGTFPCADCSGIMTTLRITKNSEDPQKGTYILNELYEGKTTTPFVSKGNWYITQGISTNPHAFVLTLTQNNPSTNTYYLIENGSKLTLLNQKKEKIDSPFNESLTAGSAKSSVSPIETKIINHLPSWMPTATWSETTSSQEQSSYGNISGYETTGTLTTKEPYISHFENPAFLQSLGFTPDNNILADGPGSSLWGYTKETNGKKQIVFFSYQTKPTSTPTNEPVQFNCPCQMKLTVFISNYFSN